MSDKIYKKIEVVGTSNVSIEAAVNRAIAGTAKTVRNLRWFEVDEIRGSISGDQVDEWQVALKLGFTVDETDESLPASTIEIDELAQRGTAPGHRQNCLMIILLPSRAVTVTRCECQ